MKIVVGKLNDNFQYEVNISGKTYYLSNVIEGETVEVSINKEKRSIKIDKIINTSVNRVKPSCNIYERCGGCKLLHVDYSHQLKLKTEMVKKLFKENNYNCVVNDVIGMNNPFEYRNKNQVVFGYDEKRRIVSGFYEEFSHKIVNFTTCSIQDKVADKIVNTIKELMFKMHILPYDEDKQKGLIRHVMVKRSKALNETMVVIVTSSEVFPGRNNFLKALLASNKEITTVIQNINSRKTTQVLGEKEIVLFGKGYINDILCEKKFKISSKSFYQINPIQTRILYETAINAANLSKDDVLLDAYCGVGTIGIIASDKVKKVIGVELEKQAVQDAIINAKINDIKNIHFYADDATRFIINLANKKEHIDCIVLDPPRKGSTEGFLKAVLKLKPNKIIYISCDPHTQVLDLKYLTNDYKITFVQPVDMFPHSSHVENIVCLVKKK